MPGSGFWFFVLIIVINLVIGIVRKVAERRAAREAALKAGTGTASPESSPRRESLQGGGGNYEVILERAGERHMDVMRLLRHDLGMDPATAMMVVASTPAPIAVGISRGDAGLLRSRLEELGAGVVVRRSSASTGEGSAAVAAAASQSSRARSAEGTFEQVYRVAQRTEEKPVRPSRKARSASGEPSAPARKGASAAAASPRTPSSRTPSSRTPSPQTPARQTPSPRAPTLPAAPQARPARAAADRQWPPIPEAEPARPTLSEVAAAAGEARLDTRSILGETQDPRSLQRAFVLAELLQPPVSMRPEGRGGR